MEFIVGGRDRYANLERRNNNNNPRDGEEGEVNIIIVMLLIRRGRGGGGLEVTEETRGASFYLHDKESSS